MVETAQNFDEKYFEIWTKDQTNRQVHLLKKLTSRRHLIPYREEKHRIQQPFIFSRTWYIFYGNTSVTVGII